MIKFNCPFCGTHNETTAHNLLWLPYICVCGEHLPIETIISDGVFADIEREIGRITRIVVKLTGQKNMYIAKDARSAFIDTKIMGILGYIKIYDLILTRFERNETLQGSQPENSSSRGSEKPQRRENVFRSLLRRWFFTAGEKDKK